MEKEKIIEQIIAGFEEAINSIRLWHGMGANKEQEKIIWDIYYKQSPEMKRINSAFTELQKLATELSEPKGGVKESQNTELSEVKESVTDEEIHNESARLFPYMERIINTLGEKRELWKDGAKWLRSRLQPAQCNEETDYSIIQLTKDYNITVDDIHAAIKCYIKGKEQPAQSITDKQIEKFAKSCPGNTGNVILDMGVTSGFIEGAKAYRDGLIAEWLKQ